MKYKELDKYKKKLRKYFTAKPKTDFWMWAFITLFLFRYVMPSILPFLLMFQVGLVTPEIDIDVWEGKLENISIGLADTFMDINEKLILSGNRIGNKNPIIGQAIFYGISAFIWSIYLSMLYLILKLIRYMISWVYRKTKSNKEKIKK